jgi:ribosomal subunit interface protein
MTMADMHGADPGVVGGEPPAGFQFDVRAHGFPLTDAIRQYATEHLGARLAKHARSIHAVVVRFEDVNGGKGGNDKRCAIEVDVGGLNPIIVEEIDDDLHAAVDRAADRVENALGRELERRRTVPRDRGHKLVRNRKLSP